MKTRDRQLKVLASCDEANRRREIEAMPHAHTPGPWIVDDGTDSTENMSEVILEDKGTDREWIAVGIADNDGYAESVAYCHPDNAHLIAAAPEMLEALTTLARTHPNGVSRCYCMSLWGAEHTGLCDKINNIITRATGRKRE